MKFVLLKHKKNSYEYRMLIENQLELQRFIDHDTVLNTHSFITVSKTTIGHPTGRRNMAVQSLMNMIEITGSSKTVVHGLAKAFDLKYQGMTKTLASCGVLCVTDTGSYCDLAGYVRAHNCTIVQTIEKEDMGFPTTEVPKAKKYIILENHSNITLQVDNYLKDQKIDPNNYTALTELTNLDLNYVIEFIKLADNIIIDSTFENVKQTTAFLQLFLTLPKKNIILFSTEYHNIENNPLFIENEQIHNIIKK